MQSLHQVKGAVLIRVNQHAVNDQLFFRSEEPQQTLQTGDVVHRQFQGFHQAVTFLPQGIDVRWIHRVGATQTRGPGQGKRPHPGQGPRCCATGVSQGGCRHNLKAAELRKQYGCRVYRVGCVVLRQCKTEATFPYPSLRLPLFDT